MDKEAEVQTFFFTFGMNHVDVNRQSLGFNYVIVSGCDDHEARNKLSAVRGPKWAFNYPIADLERQVRQFGLTEKTLEEVTIPEEMQLMPFGL